MRSPSCRRRNQQNQRLNLIPILDAVFIFIFFLLTSVNFIKIYEITSDVPIVSDAAPPPSKKKPLALSLRINAGNMVLSRGVPSRTIKTFGKTAEGKYDLEGLHNYLVSDVKSRFPNERSITLEPKIDLEYQEIVEIMDAIRKLRRTDPAFFEKKGTGANSFEERHLNLFDKIVFGNLQGG